ncbi:Uncharacterised protein [Yersinia aleksiciae]|uniref:Uncharacterized protein n=1 Tax=Yersinia aleksiciae TaxID=263819 RepID=A0A0T9USI5_YERAE|nr:Uncharacterised protein [Yersinia aleksiciae]CNL66607.1 Uncharacterised protein [Yersinia aleksiciae]
MARCLQSIAGVGCIFWGNIKKLKIVPHNASREEYGMITQLLLFMINDLG